MKHWTPRIADAAERALAAGAETVVGLVLAPHYSALSIARLPRPARRRRSPAAPSSCSSTAGTTSPASSSCSRTRVRGDGRARRLHGALAARADPRRRATRTRTSCWRRRGSSPSGPALDDWTLLVPERVADRRAVARAGHPRPPRRRCTPRGVERRARLPGRLRRRPPRDPVGPRHRGGGARARARARARADRDAERRSARSSRCSPGWCGGRSAVPSEA